VRSARARRNLKTPIDDDALRLHAKIFEGARRRRITLPLHHCLSFTVLSSLARRDRRMAPNSRLVAAAFLHRSAIHIAAFRSDRGIGL
jgi:hypothetical protein